MSETKFGVVEDTLFVPVLGRIYASENCRAILYDKKALELKSRMPEGMIENDTQTSILTWLLPQDLPMWIDISRILLSEIPKV